MSIRTVKLADLIAIRQLMEQIGYFTNLSLLEEQLEDIQESKEHRVMVCELEGEIEGFVAVHFIPQFGFDGGLVIITFLSAKNLRAAKELEAHITHLAYEKLCDRIQVHCADFRKDDHNFYLEQGYGEYQAYFSKQLIYAE
jgi:hypothetical protein